MRYRNILSIVLLTMVISFIYMANKIGTNSFKHPLHYYTNIDDDSLKLEAAKFLLENIPYHYSNGNIEEYSREWEQWRAGADSILLALYAEYGYNAIPHRVIDSIRAVRDTTLIRSIMPANTSQHTITCDSNVVTGEFLIKHIDNAFKVWRHSKFAQHLTFEEFKEYILPYTPLQYYGFINSSKLLNDIFAPMLSVDSATTLTGCVERYNNTIDILRALNGKNRRTQAAGIYDLYVQGTHECTDIAVWNCNIMRAIGIPCVVESVAGYRDLTGRHYHCSVYDSDSSKWHAFNAESSLPGSFSVDRPKCLNIYRHLFSAQKDSPYFLKGEGESVPDELGNPCIKDVTSLYCKVHRISLPCDSVYGNKLAYLATFNAGNGMKTVTWGKVDSIGRRVVFDNVITDVLYFPVFYTRKGYINFSSPFYVDSKGNATPIDEMDYINGDTTTTKLSLSRKYPRKENMIQKAEGLVGGKFLGSDSHDFKNAEVLYTIEEAPGPQLAEYRFYKSGKYRYYRFQAPEDNPHANISHLEWISRKSYGYKNSEAVSRVHILSPKHRKSPSKDHMFVKLLDRDRNRMNWATEYDGNMQTAPGAYPNITLSLDEPQVVTAVRFSPLNADNGIRSGDTYELFCWRDGWQSCGVEVAEYEYVQFDNVPKNKLYWLKNRTHGKEEMPFIMANGEQRFIYTGGITK